MESALLEMLAFAAARLVRGKEDARILTFALIASGAAVSLLAALRRPKAGGTTSATSVTLVR